MKIDTYFIPPIKHQALALQGDRLFALAHFVLEGRQDYIDFFKKNKDKFITLDSGVAEGRRVTTGVLMSCAEKINANEVICPDELWDTLETIRLTEDFLKGLTPEQRQKYKFMMVPQGRTIREYVRCLKYFQELPECSCIGISKFDASTLFGNTNDTHVVCESRKRLIDFLIGTDQITKPLHCLGYDNPKEFHHYISKRYNLVRSCDSASAILCGMNDIRFNRLKGIRVAKPAGGDAYHEALISDKQQKLSLHNIKITKDLCK